MATIDLIVLGIVKQKSLSAYDIQKNVEKHNISKWVKISTPSIYKKVIQLEEKGFIKSVLVREGKMAQKAVYSLTPNGEKEFERLMFEISNMPIHIFLDFNAIFINLNSLSTDQQHTCLTNIEQNVQFMKAYIEQERNGTESINLPKTSKDILDQQYILIQAIEAWVHNIKENNAQENL